MVKSATFEPKKAIGVGLRPSLWERIDRWAEYQGKSRAMVIEEILTAHVPLVPDFRKAGETSHDAQPTDSPTASAE